MKFIIAVPEEFSFQFSLDFLRRSPRELLHRIKDQKVRKLIKVGSQDILFELSQHLEGLQVEILNAELLPQEVEHVAGFIREWFDLDTDLKPFYALALKDKLLKELTIRFYGYRIVGQPDLFESLIWAVLGQQINVQFAFTLKARFVEQFGSKLIFEDDDYYLFPKPETIALLTDDHLLPLQFSRQKSKYTVLIAEAFANMEITKDKLKDLPFEEARDRLVKIKGVGNWTANYALMKTFHYPDAFPLEDVGVHNAIRILKKMKRKPTLEEVKRIFRKYKGWEAYATLYLWKSL
ncbi:MAG: DNA-3-methyladenine glycosylase [Chryseolinea sp.]